MSMPASTSIIPQGVGAPPPPGLDPKRGKLMCIKVRMLDDTVGVFHLGHKALGQALFDEVCRHLNLLECDYFGLEFLDCYGNHCWLDKEKPILRQITSTQSDARFYFVVKFYTPNPADLEEEYTRYLFALQVKRDLATGQFVCNENTGALMVSYVVQSECGDYSSEDYPDHTYLSSVRFVPNQTPEFEKKVMENHCKLMGLSPAESDLALLETARRCDFYGVKFHPARDIEGTAVNLAILHLGIRVYHQLACASTFSWAKIRKLSFKRKKFLIKLHPEAYVSYQYYKDTIEFVFEVRNEAKAFWKKAVEHHTFFRCNESVKVINRQAGLFTSGSSFRYFGRTQKQLTDYVREHHKRREPFTRPIHSSFARSGRSLHPTERSCSGERNLPTPLIPDPRVPIPSRQNGNLANHARVYPDGEERGKGATTISFHVPTTMNSYAAAAGGFSSRGTDVPLSSSSPDNPSSLVGQSVSYRTPPPPPHLNGRASNNRHSVPRTQQHKLAAYAPAAEGANSNSRNVTSANSTGALNQHDYGGGGHLSRSLHNGKHFAAGYLSADNEDNVSEDSYHLSDAEPPPRSPPPAPKPTLKLKKSVEFRDSPAPNTAPPGEPTVAVPPARPYVVPPEMDEDPNEMYSKVRPSRPQEEEEYGRYAELQPLPAPVVLSKVEIPLQTAQSQPVERKTGSPGEEKPVPKTYGAVGPIRGKVLTRQGPVVVVAEPKPKPAEKPVPPPKPKSVVLRAPDIIPPQPSEPAPAQPPPSIEVHNVDNPSVHHRFLLNGNVPYVLHMRHVPKTPEGAPPDIPAPPPPLPSPMAEGGKVPFSTFKDPQGTRTIPDDVQVDSAPIALSSERGRPAEKTDVVYRPRKKSLELVQRKRLPSPGTFSSQDHSVSPTTPDSGNVMDFLLRRRSASQEAKRLGRKKRTEGRRQTQPVRFSEGKLSSFAAASSSQPTLPSEAPPNVEADYDSDDFSMESRSLHEDMEALEGVGSERLSMSSGEGSIPPPPPPLASEQLGPPPPPPASVDSFQALLLEDPPYIDDSSIGSNNGYAALIQSSVEYLRENQAPPSQKPPT